MLDRLKSVGTEATFKEISNIRDRVESCVGPNILDRQERGYAPINCSF